MALACPSCEQAAAEYLGMADDGRNEMRCGACGHVWVLGARPVSPRAASQIRTRRAPTPKAPSGPRRTPGPRSSAGGGERAPRARAERVVEDVETARRRFPSAADVTPETIERVERWRAEFLAEVPRPDPEAARYRDVYRQAFSADGLPRTTPSALRDFANSKVVARPGNMSIFNDEWSRLGSREAAEVFRGVVEHLLRGDDPPAMEDRLTELIESKDPPAMTGFRESMLTRVLCVDQPERFLPILVYTSAAGGKREIARRVFDLELPAPESTSQTIGRLAFWSNDLLVDLVGRRFADLDHARAFLWWAKDHPEVVRT
jgi:hypothetical protein